jgi:hypothetical protein
VMIAIRNGYWSGDRGAGDAQNWKMRPVRARKSFA